MWKWLIYNAVLFYLFVPGIVMKFSTDTMSAAMVHAILFAIVHKIGASYVKQIEMFTPNTAVPAVCPPGSSYDAKGECRLP